MRGGDSSEWYQNDDRCIITVKNLIDLSLHVQTVYPANNITLGRNAWASRDDSTQEWWKSRARPQPLPRSLRSCRWGLCLLSLIPCWLPKLSTMQARLLQLGLTSRPDNVDGIDMEHIFWLSNGNGSSIMNFSQFCRQLIRRLVQWKIEQKSWIIDLDNRSN